MNRVLMRLLSTVQIIVGLFSAFLLMVGFYPDLVNSNMGLAPAMVIFSNITAGAFGLVQSFHKRALVYTIFWLWIINIICILLAVVKMYWFLTFNGRTVIVIVAQFVCGIGEMVLPLTVILVYAICL